jgi:glycosyltransferase involved in cell wall biosynthesis
VSASEDAASAPVGRSAIERQLVNRAGETSLSICIPTYNRADTVHRLVLRILECDAPDIEVVVLDNGSADNTVALLESIEDDRLTIHSNGTNRGVLFNILHVLLRAKGEYCMLLLDKDTVDPNGIIAFKDFLARERVACGFCEYGSPASKAAEVFPLGFEALSRVAYTCHHPSGYFFANTLLRELDIETRYIDPDYVGHFCFEFIFAELTLMGRGAIYHAPVVFPETLQAAANQKSFGTNASQEEAFFSPNGRLKMAVNFSRQIKTLPISPREKRMLIVERFMQGLLAATVGYKSVMASPELCQHYHVSRRDLRWAELLAIAGRFYRAFVSSVFAPHGATAWMTHARFTLSLCVRNSQRAIQRIARRA